MRPRFKTIFCRRRLWTAFFAGLWITATALSAMAMESMDAVKAFLANKLPGQQQINQSYFNFTYRPFDRKDLSFDILIPANTWRDIPLSVSPEALKHDSTHLIQLAQQRAPENEKGDAMIQVAYIRMGLEISLYDYVSSFFEENPIEVLLRREAVYNNRDVDEILAKSQQDTGTYLLRMAFYRHGGRIFMVTCSALESEYSRYAQHFALAAVSFMVHQQAPHPYAESMAVFTAAGRPNLKFSYPESWECEPVEASAPDIAGVNVKLVSRDESNRIITVHGYIHARAFAKTADSAPDEILADLKTDFEKDMFISCKQCSLRADLMPRQTAPLGKLERWEASIKETPCEAAFVVLPRGSDFLGMGLLAIKDKGNIISWLHAWRVFEIIANDLTGKQFNLTKLKNFYFPSNEQLIELVDHTMTEFASAVKEQNFGTLYANASNLLMVQSTPESLMRAFKGFTRVPELSQISQHAPVLDDGIYIDTDTMLTVSGHYPTKPQTTDFELNYIRQQRDWKLLGINMAMKDRPPIDTNRSPKTSVLSTENGGQVVFCSSQYNQTSWAAENLIDGKLGTNHGYASRNKDSAEIVFSLPRIETITQFCFNPYTTESSSTWAKRVKVELSAKSAASGFKPAGEFTLHNQRSKQAQSPLPDQCFDIPPIEAKYIKLHLLSNHGGNYIEMGEFRAYSTEK